MPEDARTESRRWILAIVASIVVIAALILILWLILDESEEGPLEGDESFVETLRQVDTDRDEFIGETVEVSGEVREVLVPRQAFVLGHDENEVVVLHGRASTIPELERGDPLRIAGEVYGFGNLDQPDVGVELHPAVDLSSDQLSEVDADETAIVLNMLMRGRQDATRVVPE